MKTVFIIAGFDIHNTAATKDFTILHEGLKAKGYNVVPVDISWRRKTPSQFAAEFKIVYEKYKTEENIVIGNSFGAVIAFISAPELKPDRLYLCSLSAFFKEDRGKPVDALGTKWFGKLRMKDLNSYSADELATQIASSTKVTVTYGQKEHQTSSSLVSRCQDTAAGIAGATLIEIPGAPHSMRDPVYSAAVAEML